MNTENRRVVITALGVVSSIGLGKDEFWRSNLEGRSGVSLVDNFDASVYGSRVCGAVKNFKAEDYITLDVVRKSDRFAQLGLAAAKMALEDGKFNLENLDRNRFGVIFGSGLGGILYHEEQILKGYDKGRHRLSPLCVPRITPNAVGYHIAIYFGLLGPNFVISNACASGTNAVGEAFKKIQDGYADLILTGGAEAPITEFTFGAYDALKVFSKRNNDPQAASRPFERDRDGFVLAEGSAALVLEELTHAQKRGAHIYAEVIGYSANSGGYHMVIPDPSGKDISRAMNEALNDAQLKPQDISYINAHGTSTTLNDKVETKGIKEVFGDYAYKIPVSSTKSMIGHSIGAAGAIEAVVCSLAIEYQVVPPTINYENQDPECDLDYVPKVARQAKVGAVLSNSFGFGSNNACLVLKKF